MPVTQQQIKVRKITHWQPSFVAGGAGEPGQYSFQLVLDHGAEDAILNLDESDADNLFDWLTASSEVYYDTERRVVIFASRGL